MSVVVGIDLGIRKIAYAVAREGEIHSTGAYVAASGHRGQELRDVTDYLDALMYDLVRCEGAAPCVFIEEPLIGNNRKYSMQIAQVYGAVLAHLARYDAASVIGVNVSTWKKQIIGSGRADKFDVKNYIDVLSGRYSELCGRDQDRYDASCVALYGSLITARVDALTTGA